jgi:hypothetical protein
MTAELTVAIAALAISIFTFGFNYWSSLKADRHGRMPVLIAKVDDKHSDRSLYATSAEGLPSTSSSPVGRRFWP